jgi:hypothetical protein
MKELIKSLVRLITEKRKRSIPCGVDEKQRRSWELRGEDDEEVTAGSNSEDMEEETMQRQRAAAGTRGQHRGGKSLVRLITEKRKGSIPCGVDEKQRGSWELRGEDDEAVTAKDGMALGDNEGAHKLSTDGEEKASEMDRRMEWRRRRLWEMEKRFPRWIEGWNGTRWQWRSS